MRSAFGWVLIFGVLWAFSAAVAQPVTREQLCAAKWQDFDRTVAAERARVESEIKPKRVYIPPGSDKWGVRFRVGQQYNPNGWHLDHQDGPLKTHLVVANFTDDPKAKPKEPFRAVVYGNQFNQVGNFQDVDLIKETALGFGNTDLAVWAHKDGPGGGHAFFLLGGTGFCPDGEYCGELHRMELAQGFTRVPDGDIHVFRSNLSAPNCKRP
jgi:hypothetical protein